MNKRVRDRCAGRAHRLALLGKDAIDHLRFFHSTMATTIHTHSCARHDGCAPVENRQASVSVRQQHDSSSVTVTGPKKPLVTVTGPGPVISKVQKLNRECYEHPDETTEDYPRLLLPKRKGLPWTEQQFNDWYSGADAGEDGDACSPSNTQKKLMKLARRLVDRRKVDYVFVHRSLRRDAPEHTITKVELLSDYPEFVK